MPINETIKEIAQDAMASRMEELGFDIKNEHLVSDIVNNALTPLLLFIPLYAKEKNKDKKNLTASEILSATQECLNEYGFIDNERDLITLITPDVAKQLSKFSNIVASGEANILKDHNNVMNALKKDLREVAASAIRDYFTPKATAEINTKQSAQTSRDREP